MTGHGLNCVNCCCSMPRWQVLCFCRRATSTCPLPPPTTTLFVQQLPVFFYLFLSLPQQNRYVRFDTKVNVCFDLMCDVRPKASSHNAVPMGSILFVKMWSNHGGCFFVWSTRHSVAGWLKRVFGCFDSFVHHFVRHVFGIDDGFFIGHCWKRVHNGKCLGQVFLGQAVAQLQNFIVVFKNGVGAVLQFRFPGFWAPK